MKLDYEKYKKTGSFTLASGQTSDHYYDIKEAMGLPNNLQLAFTELLQKMPCNFDSFIGLSFGGIPLAVICSIMTGKPYAILRKEQKSYGTMKIIEGYQKKGKVVLIDDVLHTGGSLEKAELYLNTLGYDVVKKIALYERKDGKKVV
jgi:orotate phosphoribosyltransferase